MRRGVSRCLGASRSAPTLLVIVLIQGAWAGAAALHLTAEWRFNQQDAVAAAAIYPWDEKYALILGTGNILRGNPDQGIRRLNEVLARAPRNVAALTNLGVAYAITGNKQRAEKIFLRALALSPADKVARRNLQILRGHTGGKYEMALMGS